MKGVEKCVHRVLYDVHNSSPISVYDGFMDALVSKRSIIFLVVTLALSHYGCTHFALVIYTNSSSHSALLFLFVLVLRNIIFSAFLDELIYGFLDTYQEHSTDYGTQLSAP